MTQETLKEFLDTKVEQYNQPGFLSTDPLQIPHRFELKEDIEISAFLTATIAWGNRKTIISNASKIMSLLELEPYNFVMHHRERDLEKLQPFKHRTFNGTDLIYFIKGLKHLYQHHGGLEKTIASHSLTHGPQHGLAVLKRIFFEIPHPQRTTKHLSDPARGSAAKRLNMFLRWMVRDNATGVDFGLWKSISPSTLSCPLDVHSGNVARKLGLLKRKQNDARAVRELDIQLRKLDPMDPAKYDFALFGLGVFENWEKF